MPELRLVGAVDGGVVDFQEAKVGVRGERALLAEAAAIEAWYGKNPYSDFLCKHRKRPDPEQASAMGRWMCARVKASDGTMQPPLSKGERKAERERLRRRREAAKTETEIRRLARAISDLAESKKSPGEILENLCPELDEPTIRAQLRQAVQWLTRFDQEWRRREENRT
jgi:hypothetical protein